MEEDLYPYSPESSSEGDSALRNYKGEYLCPFCSASFRSQKKQSYHTINNHPECKECNLTFKYKDDFYLHNLTAHIEETVLSNKLLAGVNKFEKKCRLCGVELESRCYAQMHIQFAHPLIRPLFSHLQDN
ncbi:unnamed protein product [Blepharisma stoltei]|uniref:C2H2-type domain-containing protein n=1 Tax=Blepharisma stoltei TaxID=1481888 RepID=A0AAU9JB20_9CILI|nr:unnamed protein product [Blepharisma stoltei]